MAPLNAEKGSPIALGLRALRGGAIVVGVAIDQGEPRVVSSSFLSTAAEGDRLALEPYVVAAGMERGPDGAASALAVAAVAEGRKRQEQWAVDGLREIVRTLAAQGCEPVVAALLVNRAGWMTDLLAYSLAAPEHPAVAEGLAVREALRFAFGQVGLRAGEVDEKSLPSNAAQELGVPAAELESRLKTLGAGVGPPWRKEHKMACLAAWSAIAAMR